MNKTNQFDFRKGNENNLPLAASCGGENPKSFSILALIATEHKKHKKNTEHNVSCSPQIGPYNSTCEKFVRAKVAT